MLVQEVPMSVGVFLLPSQDFWSALGNGGREAAFATDLLLETEFKNTQAISGFSDSPISEFSDSPTFACLFFRTLGMLLHGQKKLTRTKIIFLKKYLCSLAIFPICQGVWIWLDGAEAKLTLHSHKISTFINCYPHCGIFLLTLMSLCTLY